MSEPTVPRVAVLMSTYNGERYVVEQLASILQQLPPGGRPAAASSCVTTVRATAPWLASRRLAIRE